MLNEEQAKEFTPEQIQVINEAYSVKETELRGLANKNADGIFNGAAQKLHEITGIPKGDDEKYTAYFEKLSREWLPEASKAKVSEAERQAQEWKEKFENHKGDETLKTDLQKAQEELAKIPDLLKAKDTEWEEKYKKEVSDNHAYKINNSINSSLPKFDDNVNPFELKAKKEQAIDRIKKEYELSHDEDGKLIGTKDYQKFLVSDLLKDDPELKDLILTEQDKGGGGAGATKTTKGLNIPKDISKAAGQQIVREYIASVENIDKLDTKYSERFKELCKENNIL